MKHAASAARPGVLVRALSATESFLRKTFVLAELEVRKLSHDPTELFSRAIQPALWLLVFGQVFGRFRYQGAGNYQEFIAPGILAQSVLFIAIFYGITIIWERDLGLIHKFLVSPTPREALVLGKALSAGVRALTQAVIVYLLALLAHVHLNWNPLALLGVMAVCILGAACFSTFSLCIACLVKTRERFMGIGQMMTMPLFFASNAIYPINLMPPWLRGIAQFNPLTYEVDALRGMMLAAPSVQPNLLMDFAVLVGFATLLVLVGAQLYKGVAT